MPRWLIVLFLAGAILVPSPAYGQTPISLSNLQIQLWPEYDQPSMLVIYDFQVGAGTQLPVGVSIKFPKDANLIAVAVQGADGNLMNADYLESAGDDAWQSVVVQIQSPSIYRLEYYQPLERTDSRRQFSFQWTGDYAIEDFGLAVRLPADATDVSTNPELGRTESAGGPAFLEKAFGSLDAGEAFAFRLEYARSSDALAASQADLQPSQPLDGSTQGRVMLSNYYPYILGALGIVLVAGGSLYFWQSSRAHTTGSNRRRKRTEKSAQRDADVYCHQCGARAESGDRFCRVCGTKLKTPA